MLQGIQEQLTVSIIERMFIKCDVKQAWLEVPKNLLLIADSIQKNFEEKYKVFRIVVSEGENNFSATHYWCLKNSKGEVIAESLGDGSWRD